MKESLKEFVKVESAKPFIIIKNLFLEEQQRKKKKRISASILIPYDFMSADFFTYACSIFLNT